MGRTLVTLTPVQEGSKTEEEEEEESARSRTSLRIWEILEVFSKVFTFKHEQKRLGMLAQAHNSSPAGAEMDAAQGFLARYSAVVCLFVFGEFQPSE